VCRDTCKDCFRTCAPDRPILPPSIFYSDDQEGLTWGVCARTLCRTTPCFDPGGAGHAPLRAGAAKGQQLRMRPDPPPPPLPVLSGHAASFTPYQLDTPRPSPRTNRTVQHLPALQHLHAVATAARERTYLSLTHAGPFPAQNHYFDVEYDAFTKDYKCDANHRLADGCARPPPARAAPVPAAPHPAPTPGTSGPGSNSAHNARPRRGAARCRWRAPSSWRRPRRRCGCWRTPDAVRMRRGAFRDAGRAARLVHICERRAPCRSRPPPAAWPLRQCHTCRALHAPQDASIAQPASFREHVGAQQSAFHQPGSAVNFRSHFLDCSTSPRPPESVSRTHISLESGRCLAQGLCKAL